MRREADRGFRDGRGVGKPCPPGAWRFQSGLWKPCAGVPIEDRGFRYGMSVFETVAIHRGRAVFLEAHLERLIRAAHAV